MTRKKILALLRQRYSTRARQIRADAVKQVAAFNDRHDVSRAEQLLMADLLEREAIAGRDMTLHAAMKRVRTVLRKL